VKQSNESKQFLKIPVNWEPYYVGNDLRLSWQDRNLYIAYLWTKEKSRYGRVHISKLPKKDFGHWITKLISVGFIRREGEFYLVPSYQKVWKLLGIKRVNYKGSKRYVYRKLPSYYNTWQEFKRKLIEDIQGFQTERKKAQFRKRLLFKLGDSNVQPLFSSDAAKTLFGYKSTSAGYKYRNRFFDVIKEPLKLLVYLDHGGVRRYRYQCNRITLETIYHEG